MTGATAIATARSCDTRCEVIAKRVFRNGIVRRRLRADAVFHRVFAPCGVRGAPHLGQ